MEIINLKIVIALTVGFSLASILGYFCLKLRSSPILGYLIAGYMIGPYSPGYVADLELSEQLAEIGVILMMFGVGLHFQISDLLKVKNIAIPGAILQTLFSLIFTVLLVLYQGWDFEVALVMGIAIGVASTAVVIKVLTENHQVNTVQGHIAIGWLIVEDFFTIFALILLPSIKELNEINTETFVQLISSLSIALARFILLVLVMFTIGRKLVFYSLKKVAATQSVELLTIAVLALTFLIATLSAIVFGTSSVLGAFIAGLVIGQTPVSKDVLLITEPIKNAFFTLFFLTIGMLFNPKVLLTDYFFILGLLAIIIIIKPMIAYIIVKIYKYPMYVALTVGFALAQIGEFSFILAEEANRYDILPDKGFDLLVVCSILSIAINPFLIKAIQPYVPPRPHKPKTPTDVKIIETKKRI